MKTVKFVLSYLKNYTKEMVWTIISMVLLVGVQLLTPWIVKTMIAAVNDQSTAANPQTAFDLMTQLAVLALVAYIARAFLRFVRSYAAHVAGWGVVADTRRHIYEHLQKLSLRFYSDKQTGQLMSRTVNDSDMFESLIAHAVPDVLVNTLTFVGVSVMLLMINGQLMLLSLLPIPLVVVSMRLYAKYVRPAMR